MNRFLILILTLVACGSLQARYETFSRKTGFLSPKDKITAFFFDSGDHRMIIRDETSLAKPKYGSLDAAMRKSPAVAGINGGFFSSNPEGTPLGIVVQDGKNIHPLATGAFTVAGIIYDTGKQLHISRSSSFAAIKNKPSLDAAIQGGPFLIENGTPVKGLNNTKSTYRTFIATDGKSRWCIATTSSMTLRQLSDWLSQKGALGDFTVKTALNLDGGSSSAFWHHPSGTYFPSIKQVRNYIGIAPRNH